MKMKASQMQSHIMLKARNVISLGMVLFDKACNCHSIYLLHAKRYG